MSESNYKYTNDGKKVVVIGKLNAEETIVQEVFISNGNEIPSGENFVVKSLHDAPSESWQDRRIRETEENYERLTGEWQRRLDQSQRSLVGAEEKARLKASALFKFSENAENDQLDLLRDFLAGKITHFAFLSSYSPEIVTCEENKAYQTDSDYGRIKIEGMKLVTLFGSSDGSLEYRISQYRCGSGRESIIIPCRSRDEAIEKMQEYFDELCKSYMDKSSRITISLEKWQKLEGIRIPENVLKKHKAAKIKTMTENIKGLKLTVEKAESELESLTKSV